MLTLGVFNIAIYGNIVRCSFKSFEQCISNHFAHDCYGLSRMKALLVSVFVHFLNAHVTVSKTLAKQSSDF